MMFVRSVMIGDQAQQLAKAAVIATRYSCVRRQGGLDHEGKEMKLLDYQSQQYRVLPQLVTAYVYWVIGARMNTLYRSTISEVSGGNTAELQAVHALSSGLKSVCSWDVARGIEQCRLSCGGHGYAHSSGLVDLYTGAVGGCTYEGDNIVMLLQVARYLVKFINHPNKRQSSSVTNYLTVDSASPNFTLTSTCTIPSMLIAMELAARRLVHAVVRQLSNAIAMGDSKERAWVHCQIALCKAARAHTMVYVVRTFTDVANENVMPVMKTMAQFYAVHEILKHAHNYTIDGYLNQFQIEHLQQKRVELLSVLRRNAVTMADAFQYRDRELQSCLGRYDGNVYEALMEWVKHSELNQSHVIDAHTKYIGPLMKEQRAKL